MLASAKICIGGGLVTETRNIFHERVLRKEATQKF